MHRRAISSRARFWSLDATPFLDSATASTLTRRVLLCACAARRVWSRRRRNPMNPCCKHCEEQLPRALLREAAAAAVPRHHLLWLLLRRPRRRHRLLRHGADHRMAAHGAGQRAAQKNGVGAQLGCCLQLALLEAQMTRAQLLLFILTGVAMVAKIAATALVGIVSIIIILGAAINSSRILTTIASVAT